MKAVTSNRSSRLVRLIWAVLVLALLLLLAAGLPGPERGRSPSPAPWPQANSDIAPDPQVVWRILPNGMRIAMLPNQTPPGVVALRLSIEFGSADEADAERGLAHFVEHMAFNGTTHLAEDELVARLERLGLTFGADTNATTSRTFTTFALDLPSNAPETIEEGLFLLREIAGEVAFGADAVTRERGVIQAEQRKGDTQEHRNGDAELRFLIPGARATSRSPIGDMAVVASATPSQLKDLYDRFYRPENATLVVTGDIDTAAIGSRIASAFNSWQGRGAPGYHPETAYQLVQRAPAAISFSQVTGGDALSVFALSAYRSLPDIWSRREDDMLVSIGVGAVNRRLGLRVSEVHAPFRAASFVWADLLQSANFAGASFAVSPEGWRSGLQAVEQEWRRAHLHGFTKEEIDTQTAVISGALAGQARRQATRPTVALAASLLASIQQGSVFSEPSAVRDQFDKWRATLTPERVQQAFDRRFAITAPLIVMFSSVDRPGVETELVHAWAESALAPVDPPPQTKPKAFAYTDFGPVGRVASDVLPPDLRARFITFDNNVRLTLRQTTFQKGQVLVSLRIGEGAVGLEGAPFGLARLMNAYVAGGLEKHTVDDLQGIMAGHTLQAAFNAGQDSFGAVYATTSVDLRLQLQLAAAYFLHPGYRPEAERAWRQSIELAWRALDRDAQTTFANRATRLLASGDRRFGASPEDAVSSRSFSELRSYLAPALRAAPIEIAIVGDVDDKAAIDAVAATFGALTLRRDDPRPVRSSRPAIFSPGPFLLHHQGEPNQALIKLYWPVDIDPVNNSREVRVLGALASILRLKLIETVRERLGASYAPTAGFSYSLVYPGLDYLYAEVEASPDDIAKVHAAIDGILSDLREGIVSQDDLDRARAPTLDQLTQHASSNVYWLAALAQAQGDPSQATLLNLETARNDLEGITLDDLASAARQWLNEAQVRRVEILPPALQDASPSHGSK